MFSTYSEKTDREGRSLIGGLQISHFRTLRSGQKTLEVWIHQILDPEGRALIGGSSVVVFPDPDGRTLIGDLQSKTAGVASGLVDGVDIKNGLTNSQHFVYMSMHRVGVLSPGQTED